MTCFKYQLARLVQMTGAVEYRGMVVWSMVRGISLYCLSRASHYALSSMLRGIVCSMLRGMAADLRERSALLRALPCQLVSLTGMLRGMAACT